jgi:hypothetical protein
MFRARLVFRACVALSNLARCGCGAIFGRAALSKVSARRERRGFAGVLSLLSAALLRLQRAAQVQRSFF